MVYNLGFVLTSRITAVGVSVLILCCLLIWVLFTLSTVHAQNRIIFIVFDSCSYEVAKAVNRIFLDNSGFVYLSHEISYVESNSYYVVLATNTSSPSEVSRIVKLITSSSVNYVGTSILSVERNAIDHEDVWKYCLNQDEKALDNIARAAIPRSGFSNTLPVLPLVVGVIAVITLTSATTFSINQGIRSRAKPVLDKLRNLILLLPSVLLRIKIKSEHVLEHPVRRTIYERVVAEKVVPLSVLLRLYSRGVLEWHLSVLVRAGFLREVKIFNRRFIVDAQHTGEVLNKLASMDRRVKCILENMNSTSGTSIEELSSKCRVDVKTVQAILNLCNNGA